MSKQRITAFSSPFTAVHAKKQVEATGATVQGMGTIFYPYWLYSYDISIKRAFWLKPRRLRVHVTIDALENTVQTYGSLPFEYELVVSDDPKKDVLDTVSPQQVLEPAIDPQEYKEKAERTALHFIIMRYKTFFSPVMTLRSIRLIYRQMYLVRCRGGRWDKDHTRKEYVVIVDGDNDSLSVFDHADQVVDSDDLRL